MVLTVAQEAAQRPASILRTFSASEIAQAGAAVATALEANQIVYFPTSPVRLPDAQTLEFFRAELPARLRFKNVTYHAEARRLTGLEADPATRDRVADALRDHLEGVTDLLRRVAPRLATRATAGTCSFRPIEERGRNLKPHASNELVHVDAGAYGATHGDRILRFFVNVNEHTDRVWATKGSIGDVLERCGAAAGLLDSSGRLKMRIEDGPMDRAFSRAIGGLARLQPLARRLDSSPYDRAMRSLHNYMKDSEAFHRDMRGYEEIRFPPYSAWMVFTDGVSHAVLSGQFALVTTLIVHLDALAQPHLAPKGLLAARAGQRPDTSSVPLDRGRS